MATSGVVTGGIIQDTSPVRLGSLDRTGAEEQGNMRTGRVCRGPNECAVVVPPQFADDAAGAASDAPRQELRYPLASWKQPADTVMLECGLESAVAAHQFVAALASEQNGHHWPGESGQQPDADGVRVVDRLIHVPDQARDVLPEDILIEDLAVVVTPRISATLRA